MTAILKDLRPETDTPCTPECPHGEEIERNQWGQPIVPFRGKPKAFVRVSTVAKALDTAGGLPDWKALMGVRGTVIDPSIPRSMAVAMSAGDEAAQKEIARRSADIGGASSAASDGSALHAAFLAAARGRPLQYSDEATRASITVGLAALAEAGLRVIQIEQFVVAGTMGIAGSIDMILKRDTDNTFYVGDLKTSRKANDRNFPMSVCIQCTGYAHGSRFCPRDGWLRTAPVSRETAYLLSLPLETGAAYLDELDLTVGKTALDIALAAHQIRKSKKFIRRQVV